MKRVLLTGASGFIGRQTLPILQEKGYDVHAVSAHASSQVNEVTWHQADLLDARQRQKLINEVKPTHVLHFAWIALPGIHWTSPLNQSWHDATLDLLSLSKAADAERFVGAGTCAEYDWSNGHCEEYTTPLVPMTPYGKAKAECGQAVIDANDGIATSWGRIFFLYGPREYPDRLVSSVIISLLKGKKAPCTHGKQVRDFLHVHDVASAFVSLLESNVAGPVNIASGAPVTVKEIVDMIARQLHAEHLIEFGARETPKNDPPRLTAAVERLQKEVGWRPSFSLETGIADTIAWWQSHC